MALFKTKRSAVAAYTLTVTDGEVSFDARTSESTAEAAFLYLVDILLAALPRKDADAARQELHTLAGQVYRASAEQGRVDAAQAPKHSTAGVVQNWNARLASGRSPVATPAFHIRATLHRHKKGPYMDVRFHDHTDTNYVGNIRLALVKATLAYMQERAADGGQDSLLPLFMLLDYYGRYAAPSRETLGRAPRYAMVELPEELC